MLKVLYFRGSGSSGGSTGGPGHAAMRILAGPENMNTETYITWTGSTILDSSGTGGGGGSGSSRDLRNLLVTRVGTGRTTWTAERDLYQRLGMPVEEVEISTLDDGLLGLDSEAMVHWWWAFQASLRKPDRRITNRADGIDPHTYQILDKNCSTITALAMLAGGSLAYVFPTGLLAEPTYWVMPAKMASTIMRYWRPSQVIGYARKVKGEIDGINRGVNKFLEDFQGDVHDAEVRLADDWNTHLDDLAAGLWSVRRWKRESSVKFASRYRVLKEIDERLELLHAMLRDVDKLTRGKVLWSIYMLMNAIAVQRQQHPRSKRAAAVATLARQLAFKRAEFTSDVFKQQMGKFRLDKGVWTVAAWRQASNLPGKNRYKLLKTIDTRLGAYHAVPVEDSVDGRRRRKRALREVLDAVHTLLTERPLSNRRSATLELCRQLELAMDVIRHGRDTVEQRLGIAPRDEEDRLGDLERIGGGDAEAEEDSVEAHLELYRPPERTVQYENAGFDAYFMERGARQRVERYPDLLPQFEAIQPRLEEVAGFLLETEEESDRVERLKLLFMEGRRTLSWMRSTIRERAVMGRFIPIRPEDRDRAEGIEEELRPWFTDTRTLLDAPAPERRRDDEEADVDADAEVVVIDAPVPYAEQAPRLPVELPPIAELEVEIAEQVTLDSADLAQVFVTGRLRTRRGRGAFGASTRIHEGHAASKVPTRTAFRTASNLRGKHRYKVLKDIDAALDRYHQIAWTQRTIHTRLVNLSRIVDLIKAQVLARPRSRRRAAIYDLAAKVIFERTALRKAQALLG